MPKRIEYKKNGAGKHLTPCPYHVTERSLGREFQIFVGSLACANCFWFNCKLSNGLSIECAYEEGRKC